MFRAKIQKKSTKILRHFVPLFGMNIELAIFPPTSFHDIRIYGTGSNKHTEEPMEIAISKS